MIRALLPTAFLLMTGFAQADPRPSWNDTATKAAIINFVEAVTTPGSGDSLPEADRIAVFDNDRTLWAEQPMHFQAFFALDALRAKAAADPSILSTDVLRAAAAGDLETVLAGGVHFVRALAEDAYGIPPEQVVGSMLDSEYRLIEGGGQTWKLPDVAFIDDKGGKPVGIDRNIGRRPVLAFGTSDGDYEMIEYTTTGHGPSLGLVLHHTDAAREWTYDRGSQIGRLERGLDHAAAQGWMIVDMSADWSRILVGERGKSD